jgi:hypothetical protein
VPELEGAPAAPAGVRQRGARECIFQDVAINPFMHLLQNPFGGPSDVERERDAVWVEMDEWLSVPVSSPLPGIRLALRDAGLSAADVRAYHNRRRVTDWLPSGMSTARFRRVALDQVTNASASQVKSYYRKSFSR